MSRHAFRMDPRTKEVATTQEIPDFEDDMGDYEYISDEISRDFIRVFVDEADDMIGPAGELDFS